MDNMRKRPKVSPDENMAFEEVRSRKPRKPRSRPKTFSFYALQVVLKTTRRTHSLVELLY